MSDVDGVHNQPRPVDPYQDPELSPGHQDEVDMELGKSYDSLKGPLEEMLQFNFGVVKELLDQVIATNPHRPDSALGKHPELVAVEQDKDIQSMAISPAGASSSESVASKLSFVERSLAEQDLKLQAIYDRLSLSRSGRKAQYNNPGVDFERIQSVIRQAEGRQSQALDRLPETLPSVKGVNMAQLMPEFLEVLNQFDDSFQVVHASIQHVSDLL